MNGQAKQENFKGPLEKQTYVCVDCETTGLDPEKDRIIEVAAVKFTFQSVLGEIESLIDPECPIPQESIDIHHITEEMVQGQPKIASVLPELLDFIGDHIIVGHGIKFDIDLLIHASRRAQIPCSLEKAPYLDTLRMARLYGGSPINSLAKLAEHFNIERAGKHRAMQDVMMNVEVFKHLCREHRSIDGLFARMRKPIEMRRMPLGKHKGRPLREIPDQYLRWMANKDFDQDLLYSVRKELKRRKGGNLFNQSSNPFSDL